MGRLVGIARRDKKRAEMEILDDAEISEQTGVANDFRGKPGKRQVTVISTTVTWRTRRRGTGLQARRRCLSGLCFLLVLK